MEDTHSLTDEEIYNDVLRPTSALSLLSEESPARPLKSSYALKPPSERRVAASPRTTTRSSQDSSIRSAADVKPAQEESNELDQLIAECVMSQAEAKIVLEKAAVARRRISEERDSLLRLSQQVISDDTHEALKQLDSYCELIYSLQGELRSQNTVAVRLLNGRERNDGGVAGAKQRAERTIGLLRQEISRCPQPIVGTQILSYQASEDLNRRLGHLPQAASADLKSLEQTVTSLKRENASLRSELTQVQEETRCVRAPRNSVEDSRHVDFVLAAKIDEVMEWVVDRTRGTRERTVGKDWGVENLRTGESVARLQDALEAAFSTWEDKLKAQTEHSERVLASYKQSANSELRAIQQKCDDQVNLMREQIRNEERSAARADHAQLRESNRKLSDLLAAQNSQLAELRDKLEELSAELSSLHRANVHIEQRKEQEYEELRDAQDRELERCRQTWQGETEAAARKAKEDAENDLHARYSSELAALQSSNSALQVELAQLKRDLSARESDKARLEENKQALSDSFDAEFSRKAEQLRRAHNEKYDELVRATSEQISALESKLQSSEEQRGIQVDRARTEVIQNEEALRNRLRQQLQALHKRELDFLCQDIEDFVQRMRSELKQLADSVEDAFKYPSERAVLRGVWADLSSLANRLEFTVNRPPEQGYRPKQEPMQRISIDNVEPPKVCKRCGATDLSEAVCRFHPFLAKVGTASYLYGSDWHMCREARHTLSDPPCSSAACHYFQPGSTHSSLSSIPPQHSLRPELLSASKGKALSRFASQKPPSSGVKEGRGERKTQRSESQRSLQATATTPIRERLDSALFEGGSQTQAVKPSPVGTLRRGERFSNSRLADEDRKLLPSEQLAQYLSHR